MDPRIYESGASESPPDAPANPSAGYPTDGNPATGTPATLPGAQWFYKVGESLRKIITDAGLTPNDADLGQLKTALVSPQADVDAGVDDNRFVTPKKLRFGFSISLTTTGYIIFPSWLGGLIIQWGSGTSTNSPGTVNTFPITFPNQCFKVYPVDDDPGNRIVIVAKREDVTQSGFTAYGAATTTERISWLAIGY